MVSIEKIKNPHNISTDYTKLVSLALLMVGLKLSSCNTNVMSM
jgi:hypothetical protein